jgi:hypothetical protein
VGQDERDWRGGLCKQRVVDKSQRGSSEELYCAIAVLYLKVEDGSCESAWRGDGYLHVHVLEEILALGGLRGGRGRGGGGWVKRGKRERERGWRWVKGGKDEVGKRGDDGEKPR